MCVCVCVRRSVVSYSAMPGSSVHGILQARVLEWVAIFFLQRIFSDTRIEPRFPAVQAAS